MPVVPFESLAFVIETRTFAKQNYYLPIPLAEIEKAKLEQNAGY